MIGTKTFGKVCYIIVICCVQGHRHKIFQGGATKKLAKIALFSLFQGGPMEKRLKNSKKGLKITLLSLYLLYLYHI